MKKIKSKIAALLAFMLLILAAGCTQSKTGFTLEELERNNTADAVFETYSSLRTESTFYEFELPDGGKGDFNQTTVYLKGDNRMYSEFSFGYAYAIEGTNVYFKNYDGSYGVHAFFDDGYFEEVYLPYVTKWFLYTPTDGEEIFSVSDDKGIRKVETRSDAAAEEDFELWGIEGIIESVYELDAKNGLFLRSASHLLNGDDRRLMSESEAIYGNNDNFTPPEYVMLCKDMTHTRIVRFITPEQETFTFTIPKDAMLSPTTMEVYEYYEDQTLTIIYEDTPGNYPDELILYMKKV